MVRNEPRSLGERRGLRLALLPIVLCGALACAGCGAGDTDSSAAGSSSAPPERLSQYGLFAAPLSSQRPAEGVIPYDLNSALFSDYATKLRFIKLPPGTRAAYHDSEVFDFPVGTVIAKTFAYLDDLRDPSGARRLLETRILKREVDGWVAYPYVWNAEQTEAILDVAGDTIDVSWTHTDGRRRRNSYIVPNANQCKGCHARGDEIVPIGPKARHLNRDLAYAETTENQLARWSRLGILERAPAASQAPRLASWDDPNSGTLDDRARAWLEINCAHCHNPAGPAKSSALDLLASQRNPNAFGVNKPPIAAGLGSGGLSFDIVPGKPDASIVVFRIASIHPGVMMPELGKRLVHEEGVALIRKWIAAMREPGRADRSASRAAEDWPPRSLTIRDR